MSNTKINILAPDVVGKISAGEVVERPASAIKELIENSIDAGADSIEVEVQAAGQSLIRIADNGEGMSPEDAKIACLQHATSKIKDISDLETIGTMGFRGEALASIASVSQMDLITSVGNDDPGTYLYLESGEILKARPVGRARGTTVEVRNLFYNVPARRKFLKKETTELSEIVNVIGRFIIARCDIDFKLIQGDRCLLHATRDMKILDRIRLVLGGDVSENMVEISKKEGKCSLSGFISRPAYTRKDRRAQIMFINGRFVRSKVLSDSVFGAYRSLLERGRYPSVVLFLTAQPDDIDVNVHPTKMQVKFSDENAVKALVASAITDKFEELRGQGMEAVRSSAEDDTHGEQISPELVLGNTAGVQTEFSYGREMDKDPALSSRESIAVSFPSKGSDGKSPEMLFQVGGCYIVWGKDKGFTIIDQHAAHERVLYEFFSKGLKNGKIEYQNLLFPVRVDLSAGEAVVMEKILGLFNDIGFHIEFFGDRSFIVQAVPAILKEKDVKTVVYDILTDISSSDLTKVDVVDELLKRTACRAAIKAGEDLDTEEMLALIDQLNSCELPFTCPHGRPTMFDVTIDELEKKFRRK